jgi:hypothetical protein
LIFVRPIVCEFLFFDKKLKILIKNCVLIENVATAVVAVRNIMKSSFGPDGLDKMIVNDVGDVCITNDGATILGQLEIQHPAAKVCLFLLDFIFCYLAPCRIGESARSASG